MLIRCGRCKALFSLQDGVAQGAAVRVECGRCFQEFTAEPPPPPAGMPPPPNVMERRVKRAEARLEDALVEVTARRDRRKLWIVLGIVGLLAAGFGLKAAFSGMPRAVRDKLARADQRLLRDDLGSLQAAAALFTDAARDVPGEAGPEGQRAFALLLQAATHFDLARRVEAKGDAHDAEVQAAAVLLQEGGAAAKASLDDDAEDPWGLRAMAVYCALSNAPERGRRYLGDAAAKGASSAWDPLIRGLLGDDAAAQLQVALQREPLLLRARVELAALAVDQQQPGAARAQLAAVLKENPQHERAKRLLAFLPPAP